MRALSVILGTTTVWAEKFAPSRLFYGRVDAGTPALDVWYLKSLINAGVSELILPGHNLQWKLDSGPLALWAKLPEAERTAVKSLAFNKSNRIHLGVDVSGQQVSTEAADRVCAHAKDLGFDGVVFGDPILPEASIACAKHVSWVTVTTASGGVVEKMSGPFESRYGLLSNDLIQQHGGDFALCDRGTCPRMTTITGDVIYLNVIPGQTDGYLKTFLETDLPRLNGLFDNKDRRATPASSTAGGPNCRPKLELFTL